MAASEPKWLTLAWQDIGTKEAPGIADNAKIIGWARALGGWVAKFYAHDSIPWCALWVAHVCAVAGLPLPPQSQILGALNWRLWGIGIPRAVPGAVLVFAREGGGHVGFYTGETADGLYYFVLGGNQGDQVCVTRIAKFRCIAIRWPHTEPDAGAPVILSAAGTAVSTDEA